MYKRQGTDNDQNTKFYDLDTGKENVVYDNAADLSNIHVTKDIITYVQDGTLKSYNLSCLLYTSRCV